MGFGQEVLFFETQFYNIAQVSLELGPRGSASPVLGFLACAATFLHSIFRVAVSVLARNPSCTPGQQCEVDFVELRKHRERKVGDRKAAHPCVTQGCCWDNCIQMPSEVQGPHWNPSQWGHWWMHR